MKIPRSPPPLTDLFKNVLNNLERFRRVAEMGPVVDGRYEHWDRLRYLPRPKGLPLHDWWLGLKLARAKISKPIPLKDKAGRHFTFGTPDHVLRLLHQIDQSARGQIEVGELVANPSTRDTYVIRSLIEESITSSQLEGASTTTDVAKHMIRSGRRPTDRSEQMIFNNYQAMQFVRSQSGQKLTPELFFRLHRIVTEETLDDATKAGAFRRDKDQIQVEQGGIVLHVPPPARELAGRLELLCQFANDRSDDVFIHPVVRAIILHFWVDYDHPFVDGNGRTARALFYWSMLSQGYWLAEYLSISRILKKAPAQYAWTFLLTETDENDLTYFLEYQLETCSRSIKALHEYLHHKMAEVRQVEGLLKESADLNHRQLALLSHALKHPGFRYSIESHKQSHNVVYQTARTDLLDLVQRGLLGQVKRGRSFQFSAPENLATRLQKTRRG